MAPKLSLCSDLHLSPQDLLKQFPELCALHESIYLPQHKSHGLIRPIYYPSRPDLRYRLKGLPLHALSLGDDQKAELALDYFCSYEDMRHFYVRALLSAIRQDYAQHQLYSTLFSLLEHLLSPLSTDDSVFKDLFSSLSLDDRTFLLQDLSLGRAGLPLLQVNYIYSASKEKRESIHSFLIGQGASLAALNKLGVSCEEYSLLFSSPNTTPDQDALFVLDPSTSQLHPVSSSNDYTSLIDSFYGRTLGYMNDYRCPPEVIWMLLESLPIASRDHFNAFYHTFMALRFGVERVYNDNTPRLAVIPEPACGPEGVGVAAIDPIPSGTLVRSYAGHLSVPVMTPEYMPYRFTHATHFGLTLECLPELYDDVEILGNEALLINTSTADQLNLCREVFFWKGVVVTGLFAKRDIAPGEQLAYAYSGNESDTQFRNGLSFSPLQGTLDLSSSSFVS